jgi:hypothetical protein
MVIHAARVAYTAMLSLIVDIFPAEVSVQLAEIVRGFPRYDYNSAFLGK